MSNINHKDATSSIDWADPGAAVQIVTAASRKDKNISILVNEKSQVNAWSSVLKGKQDTVDLKKVAEILDKAAVSGGPGRGAQHAAAVDPVTIMVIVALTGLLTYTIRKNYAIQASLTNSVWTFNLNLTPSSSSAR